MSESLLSVRDLTVSVAGAQQEKLILDGINLDIPPQTIVGLVGGSGSGKTTTGLSILRLLPLGLKIKKGKILLGKENLLQVSPGRMCQLRGRDMAMVFQDPLNAFNPVFTISYQINEVLRCHTKLSWRVRRQKVWELLDIVGISEPKRVAQQYPHQLSGGMRQRAMIAMAIAAQPKLIIADEPTSSLDVTLQARVMELFVMLKKQMNLSVLLITHDLGMMKHFSDRVAVMMNGKIVEDGGTTNVLSFPQHHYTRHLMQALEV